VPRLRLRSLAKINLDLRVLHKRPDNFHELRTVFQTADEIAYSGKRFTAPDLQQWRDLVKNQLHQLARL